MLSVVLTGAALIREREHGTVEHLLVMPVTPTEIMISKIWSMGLVVWGAASLSLYWIFGFRVPFTGDFVAFTLAALLYVTTATAIGLLISSFMRSQVAAIFATTVVTMIPAVNFSGLIDPVASMTGLARVIGEVFPTSFFITIARGAFSKALGFMDLQNELIPLAIIAPLLIALAGLALKKQDS